MRPHRQQPTRLLHSWDFPGKSTGVGPFPKSLIPNIQNDDIATGGIICETPLVSKVTDRNSCWHKLVQIVQFKKIFFFLFFHFLFPLCISLVSQFYLETQLKSGKVCANISNYIIVRLQRSYENGSKGKKKKNSLVPIRK